MSILLAVTLCRVKSSIFRTIPAALGAGIAPKNLEIIFDQFVTIPTEYSTTGTGIGLYLCRKIIEAHGGKITAQSKGRGQGATFIVELPQKKP